MTSEGRVFSSEDAEHVCDLLRRGERDPDLWTRREREAVSRLHALRDKTAPARGLS